MELTKAQKLVHEVVQRVWEDPKFKENLLANPAEAIENLTGQALRIPEGKTLLVVDQTDPSTIYFNLPAEPVLEDLELNEEQLEAIAGGATPPKMLYNFHSLEALL